ncbi:uncharacterized protein TM35_000062020 [Trypanosoma theileri]|uniref:Uncharacterized protein n=1 Tax=Trypanosoma theileri TaxID=67003 RepID=A0A1X0P2N4_9TRYP|nr:uncharacterized protein TM35_000062020 [Trypanosoma theileri]ORC91197.1 hypothetical protein TM35_000062020 [Trypanosoma theileri]
MAASPLDFYLPPPDDRAYRRERIQRLRDHITAWRRHAPRRHNETAPITPTLPAAQSTQSTIRSAAAAAAAELPRWRTAAVSPTRSCGSRHEKIFLQSLITENWQRARSGGTPRKHIYTRGSNPNSTISRVMEVPYFHNQTTFCVPEDKTHSTVDEQEQQEQQQQEREREFQHLKEEEEEKERQQERAVEMWYGVTSNSEESLRQLELGTIHTSGANSTSKSTGFNSSGYVDGMNNSNNYSKYNPNSSSPKDRTALGETMGRDASLIDSFFALKVQSVDLAMSVHAERMRQKSMQRRARRDSVHNQLTEQMFSQTMEIPIDWDEFRRLSPERTTTQAKTAMESYPLASMSNRSINSNTNTNANTNKTVAVIQSNNSTSGTPYNRTIHSDNPHASSKAAVGDVENMQSITRPRTTTPIGRPPLRLYAIRVRRKVTNSETSMMRTAEPAPRLGTRVVLPKSWGN